MQGKVNVRPLNDRVLIRPRKEPGVRPSGLLIPDVARDRHPALGVVLAVGPGALNPDGSRTPIALTPGVECVYGKYQGTDVEIEGETLKFVRAGDVLAALDPVEGVADDGSSMIQNVKGCARCGREHAGLRFGRLDNPADDWAYWSLCPERLQPILMRIVPEGDG